jgi:hypothetical protein
MPDREADPAMREPRFVIYRRNPRRSLFKLAVLVALFAVAGYSVYRLGWRDAVRDAGRIAAERSELRKQVRGLESEKAEMRERVAILERAAQVERQAYSHVDRTLRNLQDQILDLKEELAFYRGIVASRRESRGLAIQSFKVQKDGNPGKYRYKLVLTRVEKNDKVLQGNVSLTVAGEQDGSFKRLNLADLSGQAEQEMELSFRYFQRLEGRLDLPEGFVPHRVLVRVKTSGRNGSQVEKTFDWPRLVG